MLRGSLLSALIVLALRARAQTTLDPALLRASVDTFAVTMSVQGKVIPLATAHETLRRVMRNAHALWEQTYQWHPVRGGSTADTLWFDAKTLLPVLDHLHNGTVDAVTNFGPSAARRRSIAADGSEAVSDTTVEGPLFASSQLSVLIRVAPLAAGYSAKFKLYFGPPRSVRDAPITVAGVETIADRRGLRVECWIVDAALAEGKMTFYVSKADRRVVRLVDREAPGADIVFDR